MRMVLVLQIAAGIFLGYPLIEYRTHLLRVAAGIATLCIIGVATYLVVAAVAPYGSPAISWLAQAPAKLLTFFLGLLFLVVVLAGGAGLAQLTAAVTGKEARVLDEAGNALLRYALMNIVLVFFVLWFFGNYTPLRIIFTSIDQWSRSHGYADGVSVAAATPFVFWAYLPLWIIKIRRGSREAEGTDTQ